MYTGKKVSLYGCMLTIMSYCAHGLPIATPTMFTLPIQFPETVKLIPDMRMYYTGNRLTPEINREEKMLSFSFLDNCLNNTFYLLIAESDTLKFENMEKNTISGLKINTNNNYTLYTITRTLSSQDTQKIEWNVTLVDVDRTTGFIPENSLILCCNPDFVKRIDGGTAIELPTISICGSEEKLHKESIELLLSSLDYNALHTHIKEQTIGLAGTKTIQKIRTT